MANHSVNDIQLKKRSLYKVIEDEFTDIEVKCLLVDILFGLYDEDEKEIVRLLDEVKGIYRSVWEEFFHE